MTTVRVASHVHSDWSYDGQWRLDRIAGTFGRLGYNAVLMAEHDKGFTQDRWDSYRQACLEASGRGAVLIPGIEYSDPTNTVHVPVWGNLPFLGGGGSIGDLLERVRDLDGFALLAHPARRSAWRIIDPAWLSKIDGLELWNRKYDGYAPSSRGIEMYRHASSAIPFFSLDFHNARQLHPLSMLLDLDGPAAPSTVFEALICHRARATGLGLPANWLTSPLGRLPLAGAERVRSQLATAVRARRQAAAEKR